MPRSELGEQELRLLEGSSVQAYESLDDEGEAPSPPPVYQSRIQTVASIVNTMMGTTILALPFGMLQSGIGSGLVVTGLLGTLSCVTCLIVVERGLSAGHGDYNGSVQAYLGRNVMYVAWGFSVAIILGASIVYHILMQETLYALVNTALSVSGGGVSATPPAWWTRPYAALVPWVLYPICCLKDLSLLRRFNSLGFLFMWFTIVFICYHGAHALYSSGKEGAPIIVPISTAPSGTSPYRHGDGAFQVVTLATPAFSGIGGMMMLSFFLHNVVQPLVQNVNPATRKADIAIAYVVAGTLYAAVGILGYIGFADVHKSSEVAGCGGPGGGLKLGGAATATGASSSSAGWQGQQHPLPSLFFSSLSTRATAYSSVSSSNNCTLSSDFLANFGSDLTTGGNVYAFTARTSLLLQLFTVFPILLLIIRNQALKLFTGKEWPGVITVAGLNAGVMAITTAFAALDLQIGTVLGYVGAIGGFFIVFAVPVGMEVVARAQECSVGEKIERVGDGGDGGEEEEGGEGGDGRKGAVGDSTTPFSQSLAALPLKDRLWLGGVLLVGTTFFVAQFIPM